jgi:iron complex outermembrane recepter protein
MRLQLCTYASVGALTLGMLAAAPATAQSSATPDSAEIDELVVTARKREERLVDVPVAGTAVTSELVQDQGGLRRMEDLLANVPAVHFLSTTSPVNSEITIRGSGTSRGTNAEAAVGLYRNGAYVGGGTLGGRSFSRFDLFDIERAEILRGTQGALYGRNAVGGAINILTQRPTFEREGQIFLQAGNKDYREGQLILNVPLDEDVAVRVSLIGIDQDKGFFYNPVQDRYFDSQEASGIRGQFRVRRGGFDGTLLAEHYTADLQSVTFQVFITPNAAFPQGYIQPEYAYPHNGPMDAKQQLNSVQFFWTYDTGWGELSSSTMYRERRTLFAFDRDAVDPVELARIRATGGGLAVDPFNHSINADRTAVLFQDLHLSGENGPFNWLVGGEYFDLKSRALNVAGRTPTAANGQSPGTDSPSLLETTSWAVYGLLGYDLTEALNVTGEVRYTKDDKSFQTFRRDLRTNAIVQPARFTVNASTTPDNVSWNATVGWKFQPDWLLYGKVGTAYRAGSFNTDLGDPRAPKPVPPAYDNETSRAYELGLKGEPMRGLYTALTGFLIETSDMLVQDDNGCTLQNTQCPAQPTNFLRNAGDGEIRGIELEGIWRFALLGGRTRLNFGVAYQEGEITSGPDRGRDIPRLPEWTATLNFNHRQPLANGLSGFVNVRWAGEWGGVQEIEQTPDLVDHQLVNGRIGIAGENWELAAYSDNVFDRNYLVFIGPSARRFNTPRTYGLQFRYDF